jgi:bacterioferritin
MNKNYHSGVSYPLPDKLPRNIRWARILLNIYSGKDSELTSMHQYLYHHLMAGPTMPDIAENLLFLAQQELEHLNLLGATINMLGLRPSYTFYQGTRRLRWNAGFVQYGRNLKEMIELDLAGESRMMDHYEQAIRLISDEQIQKLLHHIMEEEKMHINTLISLRDSL